ncbi:MAG: flagellar basal-body MS-ring/collar protein FliF [Thiobacillus sp.]|uniref:flagellar basal-body MS-ring/collar protein FliF n=1 Tax=Thiobacillus sp. TaxID=924 RepID=UPI002893FCFA|nr:flagellar basal-body MS-ring/collar protein FliF [Thiobacillus sp.]MDT3706665.1 flagellar basal-body MS-ring/collar protein FliF [Thiobacillus sp.]
MAGWLSALRDLIVEASPRRRIGLALLVLLPLAALAAAYVRLNPPDYRVLYAQLSDRAGGEVITALDQLDIPYRLSAADGTIEVPAAQLHAARYRLAARGLPRSEADAQGEIDHSPGFGASSLQEQQRIQHALETDLARSIQALDAIELARVHLALPKVSPFLRDAPSATAAVLLRLRPGAQLDAAQIATIQTLVAASVPRMKRTEVQVLDQRGALLGGAAPEAAQSQRLALEQDLARRALAVLTPWLGAERVSVQVTAMLEDSETRQTVERVRNIVVAGQAHPLEKTVRTTHVPEGSIQRLNAIVILGFDASADELQRAGQLARQALGLLPARGDSLNVYALPVARRMQTDPPAEAPRAQAPKPQVQPANPPQRAASPPTFLTWPIAAGAILIALLAITRLRMRRAPAGEARTDDFDAMLDAARSRTLDDPRVTADVVKLWMRT